MCILTKTYNNNTKSVRIFNMYYHIIWLFLLLAHITDLFVIDLPYTFASKLGLFVWLIVSCIGLTIVSLTAKGRRRILCKYVSLLLGSLIQLIIAYKYMTLYPPLTPMVIVSILLSAWFIGAALLVKKQNKEEINELDRTTMGTI